MEPHSIQIIKTNPDNTIVLDEEILQSILTKDEIRDRYVSVISVAGAFRQGKSFLLNFLLRYLRVKYIETRDIVHWLQPEDGPLQGFSWAPGSKRHTNGIYMWSDIFLTKIPSGEDVAIIILDTQGFFDNQSTTDDCARIFALSTLISSVQIYNVMRGIKQYDLTHLQCFGGYGNLMTNCGSAPFQDLCILVRDWACAYEHPYGFVGGSGLLEEVNNSDNSEVQNQVANIKELFNDISCFLMPYPGRVVDTSKSFNGSLDEIDEDFKQQMQDFVPNLLSPETLVLKTINGKKITAEELMFYVSEYSNALKDGALPRVETIFKATVEAHHKTAALKAFKIYKKNMDLDVKLSPSCCSADALYQKHSSYKDKSTDHFIQQKKFDDEAIFNKYLVQLKNKIDAEFQRYRVINNEKLRSFEERKRRMEEQLQLQRRPDQTAGGSGLSTLGTAEAVGLAATVIGGAAVLAFGVSKLFSSPKGNKD